MLFYKPEKSSAVYIIIIYLFVFIVIFLLKTQGSTKNDVINQPTEIEKKLNKSRKMYVSLKNKKLNVCLG